MVQTISVLLNLVVVLLIVVSLSRWANLVWSRRNLLGLGFFESLLAPRVRSRPFWTPADALLMLGAMILITQGLIVALVRTGWIVPSVAGEEAAGLSANAMIGSILASSVGGLAAIAVTVSWLFLFNADARRQVGLTATADDLVLGLKGALMILPPVMLVSAAANFIVPYEHPVLESLSKIATPTVFLVTFLGTAVATPIVEEFLVRGMLQGSLQGIADRDSEDEGPWYSRAYTTSSSPQEATWSPRSYWPLVVSSLVFACLHIGGQGAAPVPLFFLSLGLGFLYRQTGSLTPSIVVHMALNGLTLVVEFLKLSSA